MKTLFISTAILFFAVCAFGQKLPTAEVINNDTGIAGLQLDTLNGKIKVLYCKGYEVRAATIQTLVEKCAAFYQTQFPAIKFQLVLLVLDSAEWEKIDKGVPYGMPNERQKLGAIIMAADKKTVGRLLGIPDNTPATQLSAFDCICLHELGHLFLLKFNNTNTQKKWANEFLASYFAICFFKKHINYPGLPQINRTHFRPQHKSLHDFDSLYSDVGPQNYSWYQGMFQDLGYELYPRFKTDLLKKFISVYSTDGNKPDPLVLLQELAPDITNNWLKQMK